MISIDETGAATNMTRTHGRFKNHDRFDMPIPQGHRLNLTCVAAICEEEVLLR